MARRTLLQMEQDAAAVLANELPEKKLKMALETLQLEVDTLTTQCDAMLKDYNVITAKLFQGNYELDRLKKKLKRKLNEKNH